MVHSTSSKLRLILLGLLLSFYFFSSGFRDAEGFGVSGGSDEGVGGGVATWAMVVQGMKEMGGGGSTRLGKGRFGFGWVGFFFPMGWEAFNEDGN